MNADEAMALGATYLAANLSQSYKLSPIELIDGFESKVILVIWSDTANKKLLLNITLFERR